MMINPLTTGSWKVRGFTLIETVMYAGLFAIVIGGALTCAYQILQNIERNKSTVSTVEEGAFIRKKIDWALSGATAVRVSPDSRSISIERPDLGVESPIVFSFEDHDVRISRGAGAPAILNSAAFAVENFACVYKEMVGLYPASIEISFSINGRSFTLKRFMQE